MLITRYDLSFKRYFRIELLSKQTIIVRNLTGAYNSICFFNSYTNDLVDEERWPKGPRALSYSILINTPIGWIRKSSRSLQEHFRIQYADIFLRATTCQATEMEIDLVGVEGGGWGVDGGWWRVDGG
jgi:hypothetical protein